MKRAAFYARVSTARQEEEATIETQVEEIKQRILTDGNLLIEECMYRDDGYTGTILERPALDRLRADAAAGRFEVLYFYDRGRLSRKFVYQEIIIEELANYGVEYISLHEKKAETPEDQILQSFQGIFHEYERLKIYERFRSGKLRKVRGGKLLGYNPKYGYDYHHRIKGPNPQEAHFTVNKTEAEVVKLIFTWIGEDCVPLREVIRRLYEHNIPPQKQKRATWTKGPIARMLRDETYVGRHFYNKSEAVITKNPKDPTKYRRVKKTSRVERPREEWIMIEVPRIISDELFEKAQKQLKTNSKFSRRNVRNEYLLNGMIYCACGQTRTGEGVNEHLYYRCTDRLHRFPLPAVCENGGVNVKVLDHLVWEKLVELITQPELIAQQAERWLTARSETQPNEHAKVQKELDKMAEEEKRYAKAYGGGWLSEAIFKEQMNSLRKRQELAKTRLANLTVKKAQPLASIGVEEIVQRTLKLLNGIGAAYLEYDFAKRKEIVRNLVDKIIATREEATVWGHLPVLTNQYVELSHEVRHRRPAQRRQINPL